MTRDIKFCSGCETWLPLTEFNPRRLPSGRTSRASTCRDCANAVNRLYHREHRERRMQQQAAWRAANPDRWRATPSGSRAYRRKIAEKRRAAQAGVHYVDLDRDAIYDRDNGECYLCELPVSRAEYHLEHIIPLSAGGPHAPENVAIAHPVCNWQKGSTPFPTLEAF